MVPSSWGLTVGLTARQAKDAMDVDFGTEFPKTGARVCFLWTTQFKTYMYPSYVESDKDWPRPLDIYRDIFPPRHRSVRRRVGHRILDQI